MQLDTVEVVDLDVAVQLPVDGFGAVDVLDGLDAVDDLRWICIWMN